MEAWEVLAAAEGVSDPSRSGRLQRGPPFEVEGPAPEGPLGRGLFEAPEAESSKAPPLLDPAEGRLGRPFSSGVAFLARFTRPLFGPAGLGRRVLLVHFRGRLALPDPRPLRVEVPLLPFLKVALVALARPGAGVSPYSGPTASTLGIRGPGSLAWSVPSGPTPRGFSPSPTLCAL